ncbi:hypothetical protein MRB53_038252 [Persea americana]|nr:hypothetical protein MRB53_038252 [Persea americana]
MLLSFCMEKHKERPRPCVCAATFAVLHRPVSLLCLSDRSTFYKMNRFVFALSLGHALASPVQDLRARDPLAAPICNALDFAVAVAGVTSSATAFCSSFLSIPTITTTKTVTTTQYVLDCLKSAWADLKRFRTNTFLFTTVTGTNTITAPTQTSTTST